MFQIFDRYLLKEVIGGWFAVTIVLTLVLVSNKLINYLGAAADGDIPGDVIFRLLGLQMVWYLVLVVPFALALGTVLGLGRLYRDNEMVVMSACGSRAGKDLQTPADAGRCGGGHSCLVFPAGQPGSARDE